jgi:hypothetical protein
MACSTVNKRIVLHKLIFITSLCIPSFLNAGKPGLELELTYDHNGFSFFASGIYTTDYVDARMQLNHHKSFPDNISFHALPRQHNNATDNAIATVMATSLTTTGGILFYVAKKEMERRMENQNIDLYLQRCDEAIEKSKPTFEKIERQLFHG